MFNAKKSSGFHLTFHKDKKNLHKRSQKLSSIKEKIKCYECGRFVGTGSISHLKVLKSLKRNETLK